MTLNQVIVAVLKCREVLCTDGDDDDVLTKMTTTASSIVVVMAMNLLKMIIVSAITMELMTAAMTKIMILITIMTIVIVRV